MEQIIWDEINNIKELMMPSKARIEKHKVYDEYVVFVNAAPVSAYFACATMLLAKGIDSMRTHVILSDDHGVSLINDLLMELDLPPIGAEETHRTIFDRITLTKGIDRYLESEINYTCGNLRVCTFLDASGNAYQSVAEQEKYLSQLDVILNHTANYPHAILIHNSMIPQLQPLPGEMVALSEREYEVYCAGFQEDSCERLILKCEDVLRRFAKQGLKATACRMQNVFGPGISNPLLDRLEQEMASGTITVDPAKHNQFIDLNYITFAAAQIHFMFAKAKRGHIYHLGQFRTTEFQLITDLYPYLSQYGINLACTDSGSKPVEYRQLCCKKAQPLLVSKYAKGDLAEAAYRSLISGTTYLYSNPNDRYIYDGKLDRIKTIELEMMAEIKRICDKHQIKYFLVGGSMLGAIRHKGFIPWDDDLDIGMLREDYEKFAKVAPGELDERYYYQSSSSDDNAHYIFDKIRLKDTYFSTKFSDRFPIENGLFIDILVYDKTAKTKAAQERQIKWLCIWARAINVRWVNIPRKNIAYLLTKLLLPVMRLFPMKTYHNIFNSILQRYNNTDSPWLIDGVGQNIRKGAFPAEWFDEVVDVPFENMQLPVPSRYDEYLRHWYGDKYMQLLPISKRNSGHVMKRIDLGSYARAFGFAEGSCHHASRDGELYDE